MKATDREVILPSNWQLYENEWSKDCKTEQRIDSTVKYSTVQIAVDTHDVRGAKFLLVVRLVLLTARLNPLMCFVTFFECNL